MQIETDLSSKLQCMQAGLITKLTYLLTCIWNVCAMTNQSNFLSFSFQSDNRSKIVVHYSDDLLHGLFLFFRGSRSLAALGPIRGNSASLYGYVLYQARIIEVNQSRNRNVLLFDILVIQDSLNSLLDLCWRNTLVVFCRSFRHVKIQLQDVVKLVTRVQVSETFSDTRIFRSWSLHSHSGLGSLGASLDILVVGWVSDGPVTDVLIPLGNLFILAELLRWNHVVNDHVLELELVGKFVNGIVHVVSLAIKVFIDSSKLTVCPLELLPKLVQLVWLEVKLFLKRDESLLHLAGFLLFFLQLHLKLCLLLLLHGKLLTRLFQFLLLGLCNLHGLATNKHFLFHLLELFDELLLLGLGLFLLLFLLLEFFDQSLLLFDLEICLVLYGLYLMLSLEFALFFLFS